MGAAYSAYSVVKDWLTAGLNLALDAIKWVWKQVCSMFEVALEFVREIFQGFSGCFRYHQQRTSVEVNHNKVEIQRGEIFVGAEVNQKKDGESVQSGHNPNQPTKSVQQEVITALREDLSDQDKKDITFCKNLFGILDAGMKQDPQHENMAKTEQELRDLLTSVPQSGRFSGLGVITPSLA